MPIVYGIVNSKGGVAKTTTTLQIGHELAKRGKKVLAVDGDSQRSLTKNMRLEPKPGQPTIYALLTDPGKGISHIVKTYTGTPQHPITYPNGGRLDLLPGAKLVTEAPSVFDRSRDRQPVNQFEQVLPWVFQTFCQDYDLILLDPSPSTDRVTDALMFSSDRVIAPVASEMMALDGLQELLATLQESNTKRAGLHLQGQTELHGILVAKVYPDQIELLERFQQTLDANGIPHFGNVFVPYTTAGWKSPGERIPIAEFHPDDQAALAYRAIAATL